MAGLEIELKAAVSADDARRIEAELDSRWGPAGPARELIARYYDSADQKLAGKRIALRVRSEDGSLVQTVKAGRTTVGGFHQATEVEAPVEGWEARAEAIPDASVRGQVEAALAGQPLAVQFETDVIRKLWVAQHDHGVVEVALDEGEIRAGELADPILELEFELLEGSPEAVFELAADLLGGMPALLSLPSKAARGQALMKGNPWRPEIAGGKPTPAAAGEGGETSWKRALATLAPAIGTNLYLLATTEAVEAPHQLRVALRRLRSALKLHRRLLGRDLARALSDEARDMGRIVGPLRDFDVQSEALELSEHLTVHRQALHADVNSQLRDARATAYAIRLLGLAAIGGWKRAGSSEVPPFEEIFQQTFSGLWAEASELGDRLSTLEDVDQHEFRKYLKKVRYVLEFSIKTENSKLFSSRLKKLQEELGFLNDISTLTSWSPELPEALTLQMEAARAKQEKVMLARSDQALGRACRHWRELRKLALPFALHPAP